MTKRHKPRAGSLAFVPRKRAKRETPRIHSWPSGKGILGFAGYKAGMTHILAIDDRKNSPTSGMEIFIPVTVVDMPPMFVAGIRAYSNGYSGQETFTDILCEKPSTDLKKKLKIPKKIDTKKERGDIKKNIDKISDIRLIVHTQPKQTSLSKKVPDMMELALSGDINEKLEFAEKHLGSEIKVRDVFNENQIVDVTSVTKGKGFQGVIKRKGTRKQPRKSSKKRRHLGTGGAWHPVRKLWREPQSGQLGYHTRTEYNKAIIKIGNNGSDVTPAGGFLHYGLIKGDYILLSGSIPGPAKRLIRFTYPRRPYKEVQFRVSYISKESKQGV